MLRRRKGSVIKKNRGPQHPPVHFDPVDAPLGEDGGVLLPVVARARPAADTREIAAAGVEAEREPLRVHVVDGRHEAVGPVVSLGEEEAWG
jgi:hypothetical protein